MIPNNTEILSSKVDDSPLTQFSQSNLFFDGGQAFSPIGPGMPGLFCDPNMVSSLLHQDQKLHLPIGTCPQKPPVFENSALSFEALTQNPLIAQRSKQFSEFFGESSIPQQNPSRQPFQFDRNMLVPFKGTNFHQQRHFSQTNPTSQQTNMKHLLLKAYELQGNSFFSKIPIPYNFQNPTE